MSEKDFSELNNLLDIKSEYLQEILNLTIMQQEVINKNEVECLKEIISNKYILIDKINELDKEINKQNDFLLNGKEDRLNNQITDKLELCIDKIKKIEQIERQNKERLLYHMENLKKKLKKIKNEKIRNKAYDYELPLSEGVFFDKRK